MHDVTREHLSSEQVQERQPRRAALIAATSIFLMPIIASNARRASLPPAASASVSTRGAAQALVACAALGVLPWCAHIRL